MKPRRVAIFGGTFNPVHYGHLRCAEEARENFKLDRIWFMPSNLPPHKDRKGTISAMHRIKMIKLAIMGNPYFRVSDLEAKRGGLSYSVSTISRFREADGIESLYFILGADAFAEIDTWKSWKKIFSLTNFIVASRPPYSAGETGLVPVDIKGEFCYLPDRNLHMHKSGNTIQFFRMTPMDISSTGIRGLAREGRSIRYLAPAAVDEYIMKTGCYRDGGHI